MNRESFRTVGIPAVALGCLVAAGLCLGVSVYLTGHNGEEGRRLAAANLVGDALGAHAVVVEANDANEGRYSVDGISWTGGPLPGTAVRAEIVQPRAEGPAQTAVLHHATLAGGATARSVTIENAGIGRTLFVVRDGSAAPWGVPARFAELAAQVTAEGTVVAQIQGLVVEPRPETPPLVAALERRWPGRPLAGAAKITRRGDYLEVEVTNLRPENDSGQDALTLQATLRVGNEVPTRDVSTDTVRLEKISAKLGPAVPAPRRGPLPDLAALVAGGKPVFVEVQYPTPVTIKDALSVMTELGKIGLVAFGTVDPPAGAGMPPGR